MNLFSNENGSVSDCLRKLYGELEGEIDSFADEKIVNCDVDEWTEYLTEKYRVEPISFYVDYATRSIQKTQTIFYKGIMPSEKVLDFPVDCNTLTGSVNL